MVLALSDKQRCSRWRAGTPGRCQSAAAKLRLPLENAPRSRPELSNLHVRMRVATMPSNLWLLRHTCGLYVLRSYRGKKPMRTSRLTR